MLLNRFILFFKDSNELEVFSVEYNYLFDLIEYNEGNIMIVYAPLTSEEMNDFISNVTKKFLVVEIEKNTTDDVLDKILHSGIDSLNEVDKLLLQSHQ